MSCRAAQLRLIARKTWAVAAPMNGARRHVDVKVGEVVVVHVDLTEFDLCVLLPLGGDNFPQEGSQLSVAFFQSAGFDETADEVVPGQHVAVGPLQLFGSRIDPGVDVCLPPAGHGNAEVFRVHLQALIETVHRAPAARCRACNARQQDVSLGTLRYQPPDVRCFSPDRTVEPGHGITQAPVRPLDLIDIAAPPVRTHGITTAVLLPNGIAHDIRKRMSQERPHSCWKRFSPSRS